MVERRKDVKHKIEATKSEREKDRLKEDNVKKDVGG